MWRWIALVLRIGAVLWAALIAGVAALQFYNLVPQAPKLEIWAWIISLVIIGADNAGSLITRGVRARKSRIDKEIEKALMGLLISVSNQTDIRFQDLGSSVYVASWWSRATRARGDRFRLKRIKRFRPTGYPQQSGIRWSPLTGAVGSCWSQSKTCHADWHAVARKWGGVDITDEMFARIPADTRHGFTREQFTAIVGKYSEILAEPIWHGRKERHLLGVLTIDRAYQAGDDTFKAQLNEPETRDRIAASASVVSNTLMPTKEEA